MDKLLKEAGLLALVPDDDEDENPLGGGYTNESTVYAWENTAKTVVNFIQAQEVAADTLEELVTLRRQRAEERLRVLSTLDFILTGCVRVPSALPDLLAHVGLAGFSSSVVHYAHDLSVRTFSSLPYKVHALTCRVD